MREPAQPGGVDGRKRVNGRLQSWLLGLCGSLLMLAIVAAWGVSSRLVSVEVSLNEVKRRLGGIENNIQKQMDDRWRGSDHRMYADKVEKRLNHLEGESH